MKKALLLTIAVLFTVVASNSVFAADEVKAEKTAASTATGEKEAAPAAEGEKKTEEVKPEKKK